jgi:hypothetical protein
MLKFSTSISAVIFCTKTALKNMTHAPMFFANHDAIDKTLLKNLCKKKLHKDCEKSTLGPINNIFEIILATK